MASNYTTNYNLCQWQPTDQVQRTDFNADNAKLDAALAAKAEAETDREASLRLGQEAFALCLGEFLPEFGSEEWVGRWQAEWERTFKELFLQQYGLMIQGGGHVRAYNLAKWAASLYPYEE